MTVYKISEYSETYTPEDAAKKHVVMVDLWKSGKVVCRYESQKNSIPDNKDHECGRMFFKDSYNYQEHLLFEHYILRSSCSTKQAKKLEWNCIQGFAKRPEVLKRKAEMRIGLKGKRHSILVTFRRFWENIDNKKEIVAKKYDTSKNT